MNDLDKKIEAALRGEPGADEPNLAEEVISVFRGRHRFMYFVVTLVSTAVLAVGIWASFRFYYSDALREQLLWGALALLALLMISFMKVWFWLEMHTNRILREVKRVELLFVSRQARS